METPFVKIDGRGAPCAATTSTPQIHRAAQMLGIIIGSSVKGIIAGVAAGRYDRANPDGYSDD